MSGNIAQNFVLKIRGFFLSIVHGFISNVLNHIMVTKSTFTIYLKIQHKPELAYITW